MSWLQRLRAKMSVTKELDISIECDADGITLLSSDGSTRHAAWPQVRHLIAYKKDCGSFEQVRLIIGASTFADEVTENDPGFDALAEAIRAFLPDSMPDWRQRLAEAPAFETTITHVYPLDAASDAQS